MSRANVYVKWYNAMYVGVVHSAIVFNVNHITEKNP